jgi:DNA repair protein RecO
MYSIHVTEGIVIDCFESGDVDYFYYVYTFEYGLLGLLATGVRLQKSKLKFTMQVFSQVEVGFVKGKNTLRLTHASLVRQNTSISTQRFLARIFQRLRRMVNGEEVNKELYKLLIETIDAVDTVLPNTVEEKYGLELLYAMRLLNSLGYWAIEIGDEPFLNSPLTKELINEVYEKKLDFVLRVQKATEETQL